MSIDRPTESPAMSESGVSHSSRNTRRWSGVGLISSSGGGGINSISAELGDFEDIDLGQNHDPGDDGSRPASQRNQSDVGGLGRNRSKSPFDNSGPVKVWRKTSPKRQNVIPVQNGSPTRSPSRDAIRPTSKRTGKLPPPLPLGSLSNGQTSMLRKISHRRTSSEFERTYDSDESVPPDTVFYNVPVSPSKLPKSYGIHQNGDGGLSIPGPESNPNSRPASQRSTGHLSGPSPGIYPRRVVSFHEAMDALDDESKRITRELGKMNIRPQTAQDSVADDTVPALPPASLPPLGRPSRRASSQTHLPVTSSLWDPLPISKEKEAVLSQTRPQWLPPKSKAEEKRHLAQYQKMVQQAEEAELKRKEKEEREKEERDRLYEDSSKVWQAYILPNWDAAIRDSRTRALWRKGIPAARRGIIWQKCFGNRLSVTEETFNKVLTRIHEAERALEELSPDDDTEAYATLFRRIELDCASAFPDLKIFQPGGPLFEDLVRVTKAYILYRTNLGYIPGAHSVVATFLINLDPLSTFVAAANSLNRPLPLAFLSNDHMAKHKYYTYFDHLFYLNLDSLYTYFTNTLQLHPEAYLDGIVTPLLSLHMPLDILSRVWDIYAFEGDKVLLRAAVAVLWQLESKLYVDADEVIRTLTKEPWDLGKEEAFMKKLEMIREK